MQRLLVSLKGRADSLDLKFEFPTSHRIERPFAKEQNATEKYLEEFHKKYAKPLAELKTDKITRSNGMEFLRVPAGRFLMGSTKENKLAKNNEHPQYSLDIPYDYWIARYPVTNELYNSYVKFKGISHPVSGWEKRKDRPVVNVDWNTVMEYCHWLNNLLKAELPSGLVLRLPTEAEWEKAARGTDGREYPWGNKFDSQRCNVSPDSIFGDFINIFKGKTTPVQKYSPQGDSPYGCADMVGNVWEWTHSLNREYPYNGADGRENEKPSYSYDERILRGGWWLYDDQYIARCSHRNVSAAQFPSDVKGFRVCIAPPLPK